MSDLDYRLATIEPEGYARIVVMGRCQNHKKKFRGVIDMPLELLADEDYAMEPWFQAYIERGCERDHAEADHE